MILGEGRLALPIDHQCLSEAEQLKLIVERIVSIILSEFGRETNNKTNKQTNKKLLFVKVPFK